MATFRVLGTFDAIGDRGVAELGGPRQRSVLARLLVARGHVVPVERIIDDLWREQPPPSALASVQAYVSNLRRVLEPRRTARTPARVLVTVPPGYAIREGEVDAWRFEELVRRGAELLAGGDARAALRQTEEALRLWNGPAYAEFGAAEWAVTEIMRLDEMHAMAVEQRAAAAIALGASGAAVADLQAHVAGHPLREEGWRLLAVALYRQGRQGDALAVLRQARERLAEELGVDPGPALRRLESDILAHSISLDPGPADGGVIDGVRSLTVTPEPPTPDADRLFGRERELGLLLGRSGGVALIGGEAGMGKSALARALANERSRAGWRVAVGRAPETEGAPAGWAWAEILRTLTAEVPPSAALAAQIRRLLDEPDDGGGRAPEDADMTAERFRLRMSLASYLLEVVREAPLLLVLDDLHRADAETLAILVHLAADLRDAPALIVGTLRQEEAERLAETSAALARHEPLRIVLPGLDRDAAAELLTVVSGADITDETSDAVAERTGGNPFFLRETARLIASEGEAAALSVVPAGVRDVLRRRLARLPVPAQTVLREAAVIGGDVDVDVLAEVNGGGEDGVVDAVEAALMAGLLVEPEGGGLRFAHALVRDTLYEDMSRLRRSRTHARVAEVLERLRPDGIGALAHHFAAGGERVKGARYSALAAEQAERRFAYVEAAALWQQALDLGDGDDLELIMRRVQALAYGNRLVAAREMRERAIGLALPKGDPVLTARVIGAFDTPTLWSTRDYGTVSREVVRAVEETLSLLPPGDGAARCALLTSLAFELEGELSARGAEAARRAVAMARRLGDAHALARALNARHFHTFREDGRAERGLIGPELLKLAQENGMAVAEVVARLILMQHAIGGLDFRSADEHAAHAERLAEQYDLLLPGSLVTFYRAFRHAIVGDHEAAERLYREGARAHATVGAWRFEIGLSYMGRYCLGLLRGDLGHLLAEAELIAGHWDVAVEPYALVLARAGRVDEARKVAGEPQPIRPDYYSRLFVAVRGLLGVAIADRDRVEATYEALAPYPEDVVTNGTGLVPLWPVAQVLGDLAAFLGRPDEAAERYGAALRRATAAGATVWAEAARQGLAGITRGS
ncbi:BTAD domain-containing putative transcriptional regulator [Microtetraspora niveoalba]|uniref:BTAD domain-containing putative transcriptional regulator n=1 Tax=Microtetraspora niveoalba TaxID=46175 RepID=UPI0008307A2C|nr:BTAD domain-containing putative transcriptional regulator [Microtetraspora niveoalba]